MIDKREYLVTAQAWAEEWIEQQGLEPVISPEAADALITMLERAMQRGYKHGFNDALPPHESEEKK